MQISIEHPLAGAIPLVANPIRLSQTPPQYAAAPPRLGEHTRDVLTTLLKLDAATIDRLAAERII